MLSPNPLSLICALLLCLPLAILFTINTTTTTADKEAPVTIVIPTISTGQKAAAAAAAIDTPPVSILPPTIDTNETHPKINATTSPLVQPSSDDDDDDNDDESLLRDASRVNPLPSPPSSPKKIAFMFLTIAPLPLAPLWEIYFNQTPTSLYNIYIHADPSFPYDPPFSGVFAHRVIPSKPTRRFTPKLVAAARRILAHALLHDPSNSHFALISSSCLPIHSFNFTYKTLVSSNKSFIEILKDEIGTYDRWAVRGPHAMLPEVKLESFRIGSQFWILTREHARAVVADRTLWSKFRLPCIRWDTCYPEENYFSTLLSMVDPRGCVPATLTHVDWRGRFDGHPHTYKARDVRPSLIVGLRRRRPRYGDDGRNGSDSSVTKRRDPFLFARKFSPESLPPLMSIANSVIFKD